MQDLNAPSPMEVKLFDMVILAKCALFLKAFASITVIVASRADVIVAEQNSVFNVVPPHLIV